MSKDQGAPPGDRCVPYWRKGLHWLITLPMLGLYGGILVSVRMAGILPASRSAPRDSWRYGCENNPEIPQRGSGSRFPSRCLLWMVPAQPCRTFLRFRISSIKEIIQPQRQAPERA